MVAPGPAVVGGRGRMVPTSTLVPDVPSLSLAPGRQLRAEQTVPPPTPPVPDAPHSDFWVQSNYRDPITRPADNPIPLPNHVDLQHLAGKSLNFINTADCWANLISTVLCTFLQIQSYFLCYLGFVMIICKDTK